MVKYRFKGWRIRFANICGPLTWIRYLQHLRGLNSSLWFPSFMCFEIKKEILTCSLCPHKYIWNIWTSIKWGTRLKFPSEIFGCEYNERRSSKIPMGTFQLALTHSAMRLLEGIIGYKTTCKRSSPPTRSKTSRSLLMVPWKKHIQCIINAKHNLRLVLNYCVLFSKYRKSL